MEYKFSKSFREKKTSISADFQGSKTWIGANTKKKIRVGKNV